MGEREEEEKREEERDGGMECGRERWRMEGWRYGVNDGEGEWE